jgi:hypothetical protein
MYLRLTTTKKPTTYLYVLLAVVRCWFDEFKIWLFKQLFTENEKCLLNQALNLQRQEIYKDCRNGLSCDYKQDIVDVDRLLKMVENKLWN